jgi:hypothetical protein
VAGYDVTDADVMTCSDVEDLTTRH